MSITERVKKLAIEQDMDYVGVSPAHRLECAPKGHRPSDLLCSALSVVVLGLKITDGVRELNKTAAKGLRHAIYSYGVFGYKLLNDELNRAALKVARFLEKDNHAALPIPASSPFDHRALEGMLSHRHAAVAAGLGELSWPGLFMTPDWGPRVRLAAVITDAELNPDPLYHGRPICRYPNCQVCVKVCPSNAIAQGMPVEINIEEKTIKYSCIDKWRCRWAVRGLLQSALGLRELQPPEETRPEDYLDALKHADPWQSLEIAGVGEFSYCGRCMIHCPIGHK